jgi:hypothetical protein
MRALIRHLFGFLILAAIISLTQLASIGIIQHAQTPREQQFDLLILHGKLVDGSGRKPRTADVGIRGDRIVFIGDARKEHATAARTIDATGLVIAPGFIDPHTHTLGDFSDPTRKSNEAYLMQGVTTVVTGNDGGSVLNIGETLRKWDEQESALTRFCWPGSARFADACWGPADGTETSAHSPLLSIVG